MYFVQSERPFTRFKSISELLKLYFMIMSSEAILVTRLFPFG